MNLFRTIGKVSITILISVMSLFGLGFSADYGSEIDIALKFLGCIIAYFAVLYLIWRNDVKIFISQIQRAYIDRNFKTIICNPMILLMIVFIVVFIVGFYSPI